MYIIGMDSCLSKDASFALPSALITCHSLSYLDDFFSFKLIIR